MSYVTSLRKTSQSLVAIDIGPGLEQYTQYQMRTPKHRFMDSYL